MNNTWRKCVWGGDWGKTDSVCMFIRGGREGDIVCACDCEKVCVLLKVRGSVCVYERDIEKVCEWGEDWGKRDSEYMIRRGGGEGYIVCVFAGEREIVCVCVWLRRKEWERGRKREMSVVCVICSNLTGADYKLKWFQTLSFQMNSFDDQVSVFKTDGEAS